MTEPADTHLAIWASSPWLSQVVQELQNALAPDRKALRKIQKSGEVAPEYSNELFLKNLARATEAIGRHRYEQERQAEAIAKLRDALAIGTKLALARIKDDNSDGIERIPATYWPGATFDVHQNSCAKGGRIFVDVRIAEGVVQRPPNSGTTTTSPATTPPSPRAKPGPKSQESYIRLAIISCPAKHTNWHKYNLARRHAAYMQFLKTETDADTSSAKGFSAKTFEKFETKLRSEPKR
jgi:hypothetical protein